MNVNSVFSFSYRYIISQSQSDHPRNPAPSVSMTLLRWNGACVRNKTLCCSRKKTALGLWSFPSNSTPWSLLFLLYNSSFYPFLVTFSVECLRNTWPGRGGRKQKTQSQKCPLQLLPPTVTERRYWRLLPWPLNKRPLNRKRQPRLNDQTYVSLWMSCYYSNDDHVFERAAVIENASTPSRVV